MIFKKIQLDENAPEAYLDIYIADPTSHFTRKAILVIPGGGYGCICSDREGEPIAMAFLPYGYNAFVLHYSVKENGRYFPSQLIQASLAMKHIRDNAEEYGIDRDIDNNDGGYVVFVTENTSNNEIIEVFDYTRHTVEYVEVGEAYSTAVYLLNNEYTVMLIMPTEQLPDELKEFE